MAVLDLNALVALRDWISPRLITLRIVPDGWVLPEFEPGQFAVLGLPSSAPRIAASEPDSAPVEPDRLIRRAYSIASSSLRREYVDFHVALVSAGALTPRLFALDIGDRLWLSPRFHGVFTIRDVPADRNIVMIATGTGLAPYMSIMTTRFVCGKPRRFAVLHGARHSWDLGYRSELLTLQHLCGNFCYHAVISRPESEPTRWQGPAGHVQDLWRDGAIERSWGFRPTPDDTHVFLCGNPAMIEDAVAMLARDGFCEHTSRRPGQVHLERFW